MRWSLVVSLCVTLLGTVFADSPSSTLTSTPPTVQASVNSNSTLVLSVNGALWFLTDDVYFTCNGTLYSNRAGSLNLTSTVTISQMVDAVGTYDQSTSVWTAINTTFTFITSYKLYYALTSQPSRPSVSAANIRAVVFSQTYGQSCDSTRNSDSNGLVSAWPTFNPWSAGAVIGGFQWESVFLQNLVMTYTSKINIARLESSGPILFMNSANTVNAVLSPLSNFMAQSCVDGKDSFMTFHTLRCGVNGGALSMPAGFTVDTVLYFDNIGVVDTVIGWGDLLLSAYNKTRDGIYTEDPSVRQISYTTDAGAFYYYNTEAGFNYEDTMVNVVNANQQLGIPYGLYELDSWFYAKGPSGGVVNYIADPSVFPSGLSGLHTKINHSLITHFRFFDQGTVYSTANNGSYQFVADSGYALPIEQRFWNDFFANNTQWGMRVFEHDWLNSIWGTLLAIKQNITLARTWMRQMAAGAQLNNINIELCSPYPRHILQTLEMGNVVRHARVSTDYKPSSSQWAIGEPSLFVYALGVAPYKDAHWTTSVQPGNPYNLSESAPELNAAVSTLSAGPVMVGDAINCTDSRVVWRAIRADGTLLKPDRPMFPIDARWMYTTFKGVYGGPSSHLWSTKSTVNGATWHIVFSVTRYTLGLADIRANTSVNYVVHYYSNRVSSLDMSTPALTYWTSNTTITLLTAPSVANFTLYYVSPVLPNQIVVLGEQNKWTAISQQRVKSLVWNEITTNITVMGSQGESVVFQWTIATTAMINNSSAIAGTGIDWPVFVANCTVSTQGWVTMVLRTSGLSECVTSTSTTSSSSSSSSSTGGGQSSSSSSHYSSSSLSSVLSSSSSSSSFVPSGGNLPPGTVAIQITLSLPHNVTITETIILALRMDLAAALAAFLSTTLPQLLPFIQVTIIYGPTSRRLLDTSLSTAFVILGNVSTVTSDQISANTAGSYIADAVNGGTFNVSNTLALTGATVPPQTVAVVPIDSPASASTGDSGDNAAANTPLLSFSVVIVALVSLVVSYC